MIKNLIYGALGLGGATLAVTAVIELSETKETSSHTVTFDANGGYFTDSQVTNVTKEVDMADCVSNVVGTLRLAHTNQHYYLAGWTTNRCGDAFLTDESITCSTNYFAQWRLPSVITNEIANTNYYNAGTLEKFPVVFLGSANRKTYRQRIRFIAPENATKGEYRVSLDPQVGEKSRTCAALYVTNIVGSTGIETCANKFGTSAKLPVDFETKLCTFEKGKEYELTLVFSSELTSVVKYAFGIGLDGRCVKFEVVEDDCGYILDDSGAGVSRFETEGASYSDDFPVGYLPTVKEYGNAKATFSGWFTEREGGDAVVETNCIHGCDTLYAHWKYKNYKYNVAYSNSCADVRGDMPVQVMQSDVPARLCKNQYYRKGYKFGGWASFYDASIANYADQQLVTNLYYKEGTKYLYPIWRLTDNDYFVVSEKETVFNDVDLTDGSVYIEGVGAGAGSEALPFYLDVTNMTNSVRCRVSIDPANGFMRTKDVKLIVYSWASTNAWSKSETNGWKQVGSEITELETAVRQCAFTNGVYRFSVVGVVSNESYVVSIGASGKQIVFDACGGSVDREKSLSNSLTFNWTSDTPYGYVPKLTSNKEYGDFEGWYNSLDYSKKVDENTVVSTSGTITNIVYAKWANRPYWVSFNGGVGAQPTNVLRQQFFYDRPQALERNRFYRSQSRFLGWAKEAGKTNEADVVYHDCEFVTNNLCTKAGDTFPLYAVWQETPGMNWYYVAGGMTNFGAIAVSEGSPTLFVGKGDTTQFMVTTTNVAKCRVALDPQEGFARTGATLSIDCAEIPTNATEKLEWENACTVSDLSDKEVKCAFTTNRYYRFTVAGVANTNGYVVSIGAEGARYIFDVCGGNFVGEKETTKVKFYNWTVGSPIGYTPPVTTNAYVHGTNSWHYTPQLQTDETKIFSVTNIVVSGGEKLYAHWSDAVIVGIVFDWNLQGLAATNVVFTNYYGQGAAVDLYDDDYVRQPKYDGLGFLGWTTNQAGTLGWDLVKLDPVTTNSPGFFFAQWTDKWKTSRTGAGLSIDGYYGTLPSALVIPDMVEPCPKPVVAIGDSAFTNCLFATLSLPDTLTSIGASAFEGCANLTSVEIPEDVATIGDRAFADCSSLVSFVHKSVTIDDEYATEGFLDDGFRNLGEEMLAGCAKLKTVKLPIGMDCIPTRFFEGCASLTDFTTPYTVRQIYDEAFYGCTHLTNVVLTEIVDAIGTAAFKKCARLKFASFLGDNPEAVESDILAGTPRNVLVRYLENMCETAKDYCGGSWPELPGLWPVAGDTESSRTLTWLGGKYPRRKVVFNCNDKDALWECTQSVVLYHKDRVFGLHAPTAEDMGESEMGEFTGWYTQPMGGRKVGDYWVVPTASAGDSAPITVYAHWGEEEGEEVVSRSYEVYWPETYEELDEFSGFYTTENDETGGDDMFYYAACTFNGIVIDENNTIAGTVAFVFQDGTYPADGGMQSAFTATVTWNNGSKTTLSGVADAEGYLVANGGKWSLGKEGDEHRTVITKSGLNGWLTNGDSEFRIYAARNRTAQATEGAARTVVLTGLQATKGTWHVVLGSEAGESAFTDGYSTMAITIANMGQATVEGTLADGTKVATTSTLIIGDGCCCLPVSVKSGKGGFSFMLWFTWQSDGSFSEEEDDVAVKGLTSWTLSDGTAVEFSEVRPLTFIDEKRYSGDADFGCDLLTTTVRITAYDKGTKWKIAEDEENPDRLKVSYNPATGLFTGSFAVEVDGKKSTATVNGAFTDRITAEGDEYHGYGTAVVKGVGSAKVEITTVD